MDSKERRERFSNTYGGGPGRLSYDTVSAESNERKRELPKKALIGFTAAILAAAVVTLIIIFLL